MAEPAAAAPRDRDIEIGAVDQSAAAAAPPGGYVTQMRAAQNPVRFELGDASIEGAQNKRAPAAPHPQPNRGLPPHYGIEGEPQCCLCSKVGKLLIFSFVLFIAALIVVYVYWTDISTAMASPETHVEALKSNCGISLKNDAELNPRQVFLKDGKMNWGAICDASKGAITVMRRRRDSWDQNKNVYSRDRLQLTAAALREGFGDFSSSFWLGRELLQNITNSGSWDLRVDVKFDNARDFYVIYPKFSIKEKGQVHFYCLKSETPKETNFAAKWNVVQKTSGVQRLASEIMEEDEPLLRDYNLMHEGDVKIRRKRGWWDTAENDDTPANPTASDEDSAAVDSVEDDPVRYDDAADDDAADDDAAEDAAEDAADDGREAEDLVGSEGESTVAEKDETVDKQGEDVFHKPSEMNETATAKQTDANNREDSLDVGVNATRGLIGEEIDDESAEMEEKEKEKKEEGEEKKEEAEPKVKAPEPEMDEMEVKAMEEKRMHECVEAFLPYAFQPSCQCLICGGKRFCPDELSLTLIAAGHKRDGHGHVGHGHDGHGHDGHGHDGHDGHAHDRHAHARY